MEPVIDNNNSSDQSSFCSRDEKVEAMNLLEECWFFENLLNIRPTIIMPRSFSDPYPSSSSTNTDFLVKDNDVSSNSSSSSSSSSSSRSNNNKPPRNGSCCSHPKNLQRAPSMPQFKVREVNDDDDDKQGRSKLVRQPSDPGNKGKMMMKGNHRSEGNNNNRRKNMLVRTPSLPTSMGRDEKFQENDPRIGRSHKQPSTTKSCSIPRYRPCKNIEGESMNKSEGIKEMRPKYLNQRKMRRSLSDLELEEVQGFKDLGFSFEKDRLSPSLVSIIPGLQDKNRDETEEDKKARGPYLSEAWLVKSPSPPPPPPPPLPNSDSKKSAADMKEHIKFWARAVASNVHQEC